MAPRIGLPLEFGSVAGWRRDPSANWNVFSFRGLGCAAMALGFWKIAQEDPERIALITPGDEVEVTYGELLAGANTVANGLQALGLQKGDTVACVLPNGLEMVELAMATLQIGLYLT